MSKDRATPLPSDGKLDEECFCLFVELSFHLLTIKNFFVSLCDMAELLTPSHRAEGLNQSENKRTVMEG
jgi:hypothetical protein